MEEHFIGDYKILKQLGAGTLGSVLLGEHRFIKTLYALKVLPHELSYDRAFIEAFEEEVIKLAHLSHPHLVKMHTVSFSEGLYFLVTDYIADSMGETTHLAQYLSFRKTPLKEEELLNILTQIADALDYLHLKAGVMHHSLKLNNILIGKKAPEVTVYLSDFGLSKVISPGRVVMRTFKTVSEQLGFSTKEKQAECYDPAPVNGEKLLQLSKSFLQTYAFLAPEQKRGEQAGHSADIYAFGVLAYYLITGQFPEGFFSMPSEVAPDCRYDWDKLITLCLQLDPSRRPTHLLPLLVNKPIALSTKASHGDLVSIVEHQDVKTFESLKSVPLRSPHPNQMQREEPTLKPVIHRTLERVHDVPVVPAAATALVTEPKENSPELEGYAAQLSVMLNRDPVVTQYQPEKKETSNIEPIQTEMVIIRGGQFLRGSNNGNRDEMPQHKVIVDSFAIDIHPVTNEQFVCFLEYNGSEKDQNYNDLIRLKDSRLSRSGGRLSIEPGYAKHPIVGVTWYGAVAYAKWAGKRLPTEAEWEIAVYGHIENCIYPTGDQIDKNQANFFSSDTTAIMSYASNGYGLFDMVGNVYEWCQDWYGYNYYETSAQEPINPKGPPQGVYRVLRGGCWKSLQEDMRCSHRNRNNPGTVNSTYGFRCAADVQ